MIFCIINVVFSKVGICQNVKGRLLFSSIVKKSIWGMYCVSDVKKKKQKWEILYSKELNFLAMHLSHWWWGELNLPTERSWISSASF